MPLEKGSSREVQDRNFHEFRHGKTFAKTERKFGRDKALEQMQAVVLSTARKSRREKGRSDGKR